MKHKRILITICAMAFAIAGAIASNHIAAGLTMPTGFSSITGYCMRAELIMEPNCSLLGLGLSCHAVLLHDDNLPEIVIGYESPILLPVCIKRLRRLE